MNKFSFVIGNPPYQEDSDNNGRKPPIYNLFIDEAYNIADAVELITPARFLFNAGQTPKAWNDKMLNDQHLKVLEYEPDASKLFANTEIKGGVAITYRDERKDFGKIKTFTPYEELNSLMHKVLNKNPIGLDTIIASQGLYRYSCDAFNEFPNITEVNGTGTGSKIVSRAMEMLPSLFEDNRSDNTEPYVKILGRINNQRLFKNVKMKYLQNNEYISKYNLAFPEANGRGIFGEPLTLPEILTPSEGTADTYLSMGMFEQESEAKAATSYIKTKFLRTMLGILKITQHCGPSVWQYVPLQDFTDRSDIDWSKSVHEIDLQLYKKYGLSAEEIEFIESHVKEMT